MTNAKEVVLDVTTERPPKKQLMHDEARSIVDKAHRYLNSSHYSELRRLACDFHDGVLTIHGRVSSFYMKQLAQTIVRKIAGVRQIVNDVDVTEPHRKS
jgi:osmotically-inducible protein OsmY